MLALAMGINCFGRVSFTEERERQLFTEERQCPEIFAITPNSGGLKTDAAIFEKYLGAKISLLQDEPPPQPKRKGTECVYIFLEVTPNQPSAAAHDGWKKDQVKYQQCRIMLMVNTDQFYPENVEMPNLELMICKTQQCVSWVQKAQEEKLSKDSKATRVPILYTGFTSFSPTPSAAAQRREEHSDRFSCFLHVAGSSPHKGSWNILQAWLNNPSWPTLAITSYDNKLIDTVLMQIKFQLGLSQLPSNIHHISTKLSRHEIDEMMHSNGIHLCLSGMEGFGHYLNEARAVGALVVAANFPAMNEMITPETGVLVEPSNMLTWTNGLPFANIDALTIAQLTNTVLLPMSLDRREALGKNASAAYRADQRKKFQNQISNFQCYLASYLGKNDKNSCAKSCNLELE
mgnify:CR=1 FL=1